MEDDKIIDISKQIKRAERKLKWKRRWNAVKEFWDDNKQYAIIVVPAAAGLIGKGIKVLGRHHNLKLEEKNKDCRCYDASLGHYWELRRKLTNEDWVRINRRKNNGENLGDILEEMNVLK